MARPVDDTDGTRAALTADLAALRARVAELEATLNALPDLLFEVDAAGRIHGFRAPQPKALYLAPERFLGKTVEEVLPGEAGKVGMAAIARAAHRGQDSGSVYSLEMPGGTRWYEISVAAMGEPTEAGQRFVVLARDITERRRIEEELERSQALYHDLVETSQDLIWQVDTEGRFTYLNPAWEAVLGYPLEQMLGRPFTDFEPPEYARRDLEQHAHLLAGGTLRGLETVCLARDGRPVHLLMTARGYRDQQGKVQGARGTAYDVTGRRAAEERISSLAELLDLAPNSIMVHGVDGHILYANQRALDLHGYSREEFLALDLARLDAPVSRELIEPRLRELQERAEAVFEVEHLRKDGTSFPLEVSARLTDWGGRAAILSMATDITQRRLEEASSREREAQLREAQEIAQLGSYSLDVASERWTSSPLLDRIFGISGDYVRDVRGWAALVHPDDRQGTMDYFLGEVLDRGQPFDRVYRIQRPADGQTRWVHGHGRLGLDQAGQVVSMVGTIQDVTERRLAEEQRLEMERRLLHAQKLESLGVLAGGIAHDFNNLLLAILANLDLAQQDLPPASPAWGSIEEAMRAARRGADLTRQMLAYSGRGRFQMQVVDLSALVEENVQILRAALAKTAVLSLQLDRAAPRIQADPAQLQQVVMNLLTNASESLGQKPGVVTLTTGCGAFGADELARSRLQEKPPPGRFVFLEVRDSGCGMGQEAQQRLFDPFFTTKFAGRGLGLAAVLGIVRAHRGAISVDSGVGEGTTIRILFPVAELPAGAQEPAASVLPPPASRRARILVVDDDEGVLPALGALLRRLGHEVVTAISGEQAVAIFREQGAALDCVLLDMTMPGMDGVTTYRDLERIRPGVRVVLSSGFAEEDLAARFAGLGIAGFLEKPYSRERLEAVLGGLLDR